MTASENFYILINETYAYSGSQDSIISFNINPRETGDCLLDWRFNFDGGILKSLVIYLREVLRKTCVSHWQWELAGRIIQVRQE